MTIFRRVSRGIDDPRPALEASTSASAFMLGDFDNKDTVVVSRRDHVINTDAIETLVNDHRDDDDSSVSTNYSNSSSGSSLTSYQPSCMTTTSYEKAAAQHQEAEELAQAILHDYQVKLDDKSGSVVVSMEVPEGVDVDQLQVQVDNGILRVRGETFEDHDGEDDDADALEEEEGQQLLRKISNGSSSTGRLSSSSTSRHHRRRSSSVEQTFQLDEHALDLDKMTASFTDGVLTIAAPKNEAAEETIPRPESLPIHAAKPPRLLTSKDSFRVIVNIPGVQAEDIFVTYKQSKLCISACRHFGRVRSFKRTIPVDSQQYQANPDLVKIFLHEGQLTIIVPPKETQGSTRLIEIQE